MPKTDQTSEFDPRLITNEGEFRAWHQHNLRRLAELRQKHMQEWEYRNSEEYRKRIAREVLGETHEDIPPPWED